MKVNAQEFLSMTIEAKSELSPAISQALAKAMATTQKIESINEGPDGEDTIEPAWHQQRR